MTNLEVKLAGMNVDVDALYGASNLIYEGNPDEALRDLLDLTPETISAAYARISRDPRDVDELRKISRKEVEKSRKTNKSLIFDMGHKSIAEHAFFNFDIKGISRLAVEYLQSKRLMSFTEKSQRYVTLNGDFIIPEEFKGTKEESTFTRLINDQNKFYENNIEKIHEYHKSQNYTELFRAFNCIEPSPKNRIKQKRIVKGLANEDVRYVLSLATETQLGCSTSARNLESVITMLRSQPLVELKELGNKLHEQVDGVAPSVIKYTEPTEYFQKTKNELKKATTKLFNTYGGKISTKKDVKIFNNLKGDNSILAGILFSSSNKSYTSCLNIVEQMNNREKHELVDLTNLYQKVHDPKLREFELGSRVTEFVMSSGAFGQFKRHRMNTIIPQAYSPELGTTQPKSFIETNISPQFHKLMDESQDFYEDLLSKGYSQEVAEYVLTNSHKRRVLLDANNRQVHAICAERKNLAAQWDIRNLITKYSDLIQKESPITLRNLPGKHEFDDFYNFEKMNRVLGHSK